MKKKMNWTSYALHKENATEKDNKKKRENRVKATWS